MRVPFLRFVKTCSPFVASYTVVPTEPYAESDVVSETVAAVPDEHVGRYVLDNQSGRQPAPLVGRSHRQRPRASIRPVRRNIIVPTLLSRAYRRQCRRRCDARP